MTTVCLAAAAAPASFCWSTGSGRASRPTAARRASFRSSMAALVAFWRSQRKAGMAKKAAAYACSQGMTPSTPSRPSRASDMRFTGSASSVLRITTCWINTARGSKEQWREVRWAGSTLTAAGRAAASAAGKLPQRQGLALP